MKCKVSLCVPFYIWLNYHFEIQRNVFFESFVSLAKFVFKSNQTNKPYSQYFWSRLQESRYKKSYIRSHTQILLLQSFLSTTILSSSSNNFTCFFYHFQSCHIWFSLQPFIMCNVNLLHPSNRCSPRSASYVIKPL